MESVCSGVCEKETQCTGWGMGVMGSEVRGVRGYVCGSCQVCMCGCMYM